MVPVARGHDPGERARRARADAPIERDRVRPVDRRRKVEADEQHVGAVEAGIDAFRVSEAREEEAGGARGAPRRGRAAPTTSARRSRWRPGPVPAPGVPSWSASWTSGREAWRAGSEAEEDSGDERQPEGEREDLPRRSAGLEIERQGDSGRPQNADDQSVDLGDRERGPRPARQGQDDALGDELADEAAARRAERESAARSRGAAPSRARGGGPATFAQAIRSPRPTAAKRAPRRPAEPGGGPVGRLPDRLDDEAHPAVRVGVGRPRACAATVSSSVCAGAPRPRPAGADPSSRASASCGFLRAPPGCRPTSPPSRGAAATGT